jgi:peptidyl-tRNA hydrolase
MSLHLSPKRLLSAQSSTPSPLEAKPTDSATAQCLSPVKRNKIPHLVVYALGNYPWPQSRHSLPQSLLPFLSQHYGFSGATTSKPSQSRTSRSPTVAQTMELDRKHQCWIGGGLIEYEPPRKAAKSRPGNVENEGVKHSAILTLVIPRKFERQKPNHRFEIANSYVNLRSLGVLMNIAGRPVPFLLKSADILPHVKKAAGHVGVLEIDASPTLVVLHDSLEIPPMTLTKPRRNVGPQGHNGLRSIEGVLGTRDFWRIGLGIGRPSGGKSRGDGIADWVLSDIKPDSDERIFWEGEGVAAIRRSLDQIAAASVRQ